MAVLVVFAAVITPFIAMAEGWLVWWGSPVFHDGAEAALTLGPALIVALLTTLPLLVPSRVNRVARLAVIVPAIHVGLVVALYAIWQSADIPLIRDGLVSFLEHFEVPSLVGGSSTLAIGALVAAALLLVALAHNRLNRRRMVPGWLRPTVTFAISYLFVLSFWLPLAAVLWAPALHGGNNTAYFVATLVTPGLIAAVISISAATRPDWWARNAGFVGFWLVFALGAGLALRFNTEGHAQALFINLIPVIVMSAMVALGAVVALALCQWRELRFHRFDGRRPAPWVQRGVIEADLPPGTPVGVIRFLGWLSGFCAEMSPFSIRTTEGHVVRVPRGSQLSAAPGPYSVASNAGDYTVALRVGDTVAAAGFEAPVADGPFRGSDAPLPSDRGVLVFGPHDPPLRQSLVLLLWRPCALYLLAAMVAVIPALLGFDGSW